MVYSLMGITINIPNDFNSIQEGLNNASAGDSVLVSTGIYYENIIWPNINGIILKGSGVDESIIDGQGIGTVLGFFDQGIWDIDSSTIVQGFTIQNGFANHGVGQGSGGGILLEEASPKLIDLLIENSSSNTYGHGGGISLNNSYGVLDGIIVQDCYADHGGGINLAGGMPILRNVIAQNNEANSGCGGIWAGGTIPTFYNVSVNNNVANHTGGICIEHLNVDIEVSNLKIKSNTSLNNGGGLSVFRGHVTLKNSEIIDNFSFDNGGGIRVNENSSLNLINVNVINNSAEDNGYGIFLAHNAILRMFNSILWNNTDNEIFIDQFSPYSYFYAYYSNILNVENSILDNDNGYIFIDESVISIDPIFNNPEDFDFTLQSNSPCIDNGTAFFEGFVDLSPSEYHGLAPDIGAFEYFGELEGCTDPNAINFNPNAVIDNGSCNYECENENPVGCLQFGCQPNEVCLQMDDCIPSYCECDNDTGTWTCTEDCNGGECVEISYGCTYEAAINFDINATIDNETCIFLEGDFNNDGDLNILDVVLLVNQILDN